MPQMPKERRSRFIRGKRVDHAAHQSVEVRAESRTGSREQPVRAGPRDGDEAEDLEKHHQVSAPALSGIGGLDPTHPTKDLPVAYPQNRTAKRGRGLRVPKLYMETSAAGSPILSGPWKAWAQSSTRSRPRSLANFATPSRSMRPPNRCATRTTRVRGVRAASSVQGRGASVSGSMSIGTARKPCSCIMRTMSGCVMAETRTSSPARRPRATSHRSHPLLTEKQTSPSSSKEHSRKTSSSHFFLLNRRPHERTPKDISATEMSNLCRAYIPRHSATLPVLPNLIPHLLQPTTPHPFVSTFILRRKFTLQNNLGPHTASF